MSLAAFAALLEGLLFTPARQAKLALLREWFAGQPDPERGFGLAALTGELSFAAAKPALIRALAAERTDPVLFALSYDYVGDLAETVALIWPAPPPAGGSPALLLSEVVENLARTPKRELPSLLAGWLDGLEAGARLALIKLVTGGLRVGAAARLARLALAEWSGRPVEEIEEVWHSLSPPYLPLFAWLEGRGPRPTAGAAPVFRPPMLAHPLEEADLSTLTPGEWLAEWKWDGIRVQIAAGPGGRRIFSRTGEDITAAFPDIADHLGFHAVLDGELLVLREGKPAPFADLQQRLNRRQVPPRLLRAHPAHVRLYDMLFEGEEDLRPLPTLARRARLEAWFARVRPARMDLSPLIPFADTTTLAQLRAEARTAGIEGLMLKRADAPYVAGRVKGLWWKWKRDPLTIDAVLMYAQRGHGKRSSVYSDYTFGLWRPDGAGGEELVPVGKAYSGYTDRELAWLDRWIREHTIARFGPVREVEKSLVLEVAFDGVQRSTRHRSGLALRFPRIARLRPDKPAAEADRLAVLERWLPGEGD